MATLIGRIAHHHRPKFHSLEKAAQETRIPTL